MQLPQSLIKKSITLDEAQQRLADSQQTIEDIRGPLSDWEPIVQNNRFAMKYRPTGREYTPTNHCLNNIATIGNTSTFFVRSLREPFMHPTKEDTVLYERDESDAELLVHTLKNTLFRSDRIDQSEPRLFRTWKDDGTMRALLSNKYAIVNNQWVMEQWRKSLPQDSLVTRWRGDADSIFGEVILPDGFQSTDESDYGVGFSLGNSEIGTRRVESLPFIFRSICTNGMILGRSSGTGINKVHRGNINLEELSLRLRSNLENETKQLGTHLKEVLKLQNYKTVNSPLVNVFAQIARELDITKRDTKGSLTKFPEEHEVLGERAYSLFGIQQSITRWSQTLDNDSWLDLDQKAGKLSTYTPEKWNATLVSSRTLSSKEIERVTGIAV